MTLPPDDPGPLAPPPAGGVGPVGGPPTTAQLLKDLATGVSDLVRDEVRLARAKVSTKLSHIQSGVAAMAGAGIVALPATFVLLMALAYGLQALFDMQMWLATLLVGLAAACVAYFLFDRGRRELRARNL